MYIVDAGHVAAWTGRAASVALLFLSQTSLHSVRRSEPALQSIDRH